jgi:hypothetical protein
MNKPYTYTNSKGDLYYLNMKEVKLLHGKIVPIRYFTRDLRPDSVQTELPADMVCFENPRNGFISLKRITPQEDNDHA